MGKRRCQPKAPRHLPPHVRRSVEVLREEGATDIEVLQRRHYRVYFTVAGEKANLTLGITPRNGDDQVVYVRQQVARLRRLQAQ